MRSNQAYHDSFTDRKLNRAILLNSRRIQLVSLA